MLKTKPVNELTIDDLKKSPIWEWAIDSEENEEQDETWVRPAETKDFTVELNGSIVLGEAKINNEEPFPIMCSVDMENATVSISSIILYDKEQDEYHAIEDRVKEINFPLLITISLQINEQIRFLNFTANKVDIYKNHLTTNLF
ncbi:hypothetical protein B0H99_103187 [Planomicrobium soli]|uniref:Uncharacterized protein n=1 Tax=Planomicrobium soli TaxID=1176648 RepID=A0A2P8H4D0_9BACL|nr:hypothetical protein [Planomicrobium soli]PSL41053.1 hypothetical protein B0H99_103187 [Planomicrobium soli]